MSRIPRARMDWLEAAMTDVDGVVVWWTRVPGNRLAEVHHTGPYRGRLRVWEQRGHGPLVRDEPVHLTRDARGGPMLEDVLSWQQMLANSVATGQRVGAPATAEPGR